MDGYSVKDAALVLGIPERRVWELIARGVLGSAPEGPDGMRVFLQPRTAPVDPSEPRIYRADDPEPPRQNGNGGGHEMSPFRELLTEFRSLTERYGQALLALGEARGEVASLRGRVELLEARMDLRLPTARPASTVAWEIPGYGTQPPDAEAPDPEPLEDEPAEAHEAEAEEDAEPMPAETADQAEPAEQDPEPDHGAAAEQEADAATPDVTQPSLARQRRAATRRRKIHGGRSALAGLAEALARADDPTLSELPGAREAVDALAALQRDVEEAPIAEPEADEEPSAGAAEHVADDTHAGESAPAEVTVIEVDLREDALLASSAPAVSMPEAALADEQPAAAEPTAVEEGSEDDVEPTADVGDEAESAEPEPVFEPEPVAAEEPITAPAEERAISSIFSTDVIEPDWFADGDFTWLEAAQAESAQSSEAAPAPGDPEPGPAPASDASAPDMAAEPPAAPVSFADAAEEAFEPSAQDETRAQEEARAAIQDAFAAPRAAESDQPLATEAFDSMPIEEAADIAADDGAEQQATGSETDVEPDEAIQQAFEEQPAVAVEQETEPAPEPEDEIQDAFGQPEQQAPEPTQIPDVATPDSQPKAAPAAGEEELMWLGDEFEEAGLEAAPGWRSADAPPPPASASRAVGMGTSPTTGLELSDAELGQLAQDEGWDAAEVEAIRALLGRAARADAEPSVGSDAGATPTNATLPSVRRPNPMASMSDPQWLKGRRGPAATAYRRLRRLFPG